MPYTPIFQTYIRAAATPSSSVLPMSVRNANFFTSRRIQRALSSKFSFVPFTMRNRAIGCRNFYLPSSNWRPHSGVVRFTGFSAKTVEVEWKQRPDGVGFRQSTIGAPFWHQQSSDYGRFAYKEVSSDDSDNESGSAQRQMCGSTLDNIDEWKWKLTMLLRNKDEQEVVSREKKDRRDFEHLSALATRMGLHSRQYSKVVVFSKVPLPNYRSDLDEKRPQREVILPFSVHKEVVGHLKAYDSQKSTYKETTLDGSLPRLGTWESINTNETISEEPESPTQNSIIKEKILRRKSLQLRTKQQEWQESPDGQKMLEFRRSLPAFKEKDALLKAISENQLFFLANREDWQLLLV